MVRLATISVRPAARAAASVARTRSSPASVVAANTKTITVDGNDKEIVYGIFGDDSGTIQFTAWDSARFQYGGLVTARCTDSSGNLCSVFAASAR